MVRQEPIKQTPLQRFIEAGERKLVELQPGSEEYVRCAAKLHAEMLRRFPDGIDLFPDEDLLGQWGNQPLTKRDLEEQIIQDQMVNREDDESDFVGHAGNNDNDDCENEHGGFKWRIIPRHEKQVKAANNLLRESSDDGKTITDGVGSGVSPFGMPHPDALPHGFVADPTIHCAVDPVSIDDFVMEQFAEADSSYIKPHRNYHDRTAKMVFEAAQSWKCRSYSRQACATEGCERECIGNGNAKYCDVCSTPQMRAMRRRLKRSA